MCNSKKQNKSLFFVQNDQNTKEFMAAKFAFDIFTFIILLTLIFQTISQSKAEVIDCIDGKNMSGEICERCGDNCNWSFNTESGKLSISGSGEMYDYVGQYIEPWGGYNASITQVDISGIEYIGKQAFLGYTNLSQIKLGNSVKKLGEEAFWADNIEILEISDSVTEIEEGVFSWNPLKYVTIHDTLDEIDIQRFNVRNSNILCVGNHLKCENIAKKLSSSIMNMNYTYSLADYTNCKDTNYYWDGAECVREPDVRKRKCCDSCKDMGGYCNRIRYTPAEAAQVLQDDNNTIVITFKK